MNLQSTDPEYTQRLGAFLEEVRNEPDSMLEPTTRWLAILATLTGNGSVDAYKEALPQALQEGLNPVAVKEMVYQATDYLGYGRALPFLHATNDALTAAGIALPLPGQATTTMNDRLEKGIAAQVKIFGEHMNEAWKVGTVNRYLAANCFGDYYTRRAGSGPARDDHLLLSLCPRGLRAPVDRPRQGQYEHGQRRSVPDQSGAPVSALHRLSSQPKRHRLHCKSRQTITKKQEHPCTAASRAGVFCI